MVTIVVLCRMGIFDGGSGWLIVIRVWGIQVLTRFEIILNAHVLQKI